MVEREDGALAVAAELELDRLRGRRGELATDLLQQRRSALGGEQAGGGDPAERYPGGFEHVEGGQQIGTIGLVHAVHGLPVVEEPAELGRTDPVTGDVADPVGDDQQVTGVLS